MHGQSSGFHARQLFTGHLPDDLERLLGDPHLIGVELLDVLQYRHAQVDVLVLAFDRKLQVVGQGDRLGGREGHVEFVGDVVDDVDGRVDDDCRNVADDPVVAVLDVVEGAVDLVERDVLIRPVETDALAKSDDFSSFGVDAVCDVVVDAFDDFHCCSRPENRI